MPTSLHSLYRHGGRRPATHDFGDYSSKVMGGPPSRTMTGLGRQYINL